MPYYPTIEQDLQRADEILGKSNGGESTIYGVDNTAAYQLLKSFTEHIRYLHQQQEAYNHQIEELETYKRRAVALNTTAQKQIREATEARDHYKDLVEHHQTRERRLGPLAESHPALTDHCAACNQPFVAGDYVTLIPIGPGDNLDERKRAAAGRPYNAMAVLAHWACVTGKDEA